MKTTTTKKYESELTIAGHEERRNVSNIPQSFVTYTFEKYTRDIKNIVTCHIDMRYIFLGQNSIRLNLVS